MPYSCRRVCHGIFPGKNGSPCLIQTTLPDIISDILPALASKNPQVKEGTLKFLGRCLATSATSIQSTQIKTLSDPLITLLEDGYEGARNEAAVCLGALIKMVGERPMNAVLEGLADVRKAKVKEASEKATVKCKLGTGGPAKASVGTKKAPPKKAETSKSASLAANDGDDPPLPKPPAKVVAKPVC
jgi:cytoskeleton-associated protein 5